MRALQRRGGREILGTLSVLLLAMSPLPAADPHQDRAAFEEAAAGPWKEVFFDEFTGDWRDKWFLDGEIGTAENSPAGLRLAGGPRFGDNAHHVVLWTKDSFEGDVKIEYDYTRLDFEVRGVNILYLHATGSGTGPFARDITKWNGLRKVPAMRMYFDHMNLYHISYAAFPDETDPSINYIRGRRYLPETGKGLEGTDLTPDHYPPGLFAPGVPHHITVIKRGTDLLVRIKTDQQVFHGKMSNTTLPDVTAGRLGLRHMQTRSARYKNFRISERPPARPGSAHQPKFLRGESHSSGAIRPSVQGHAGWIQSGRPPPGIWPANKTTLGQGEPPWRAVFRPDPSLPSLHGPPLRVAMSSEDHGLEPSALTIHTSFAVFAVPAAPDPTGAALPAPPGT